MLEYFYGIYADFLKLGGLDQLLAVGSILGLLSLMVGGTTSLIKRQFKIKQRELEKIALDRQNEIDKLNKTILDNEADIRKLELELPKTWIELAKRDWEEGNVEAAVDTFRQGLEDIRSPLHNLCRQLAEGCSSQPESESTTNSDADYCRPKRMLLLASQLCPENMETRTLLTELMASHATAKADYNPTDGLWDHPYMFMHSDISSDSLVQELIKLLINMSAINVEMGRYHEGSFVARCAVIFASRKLGGTAQLTVYARFQYAAALLYSAWYEDALVEADAVIAIRAEVLPEHHKDLVQSRLQRTNILTALKRNEDAVAELQYIEDVLIASGADEIPWLLRIKEHKAALFYSLGRCNEVLDEVDKLPSEAKEISDVLGTTPAIARIRLDSLIQLNRYDEALKEIADLLPVFTQEFGARHPETLELRRCAISANVGIGRYEEAKSEIEVLVPLVIEAVGERHPYAANAMSLEAEIREILGKSK